MSPSSTLLFLGPLIFQTGSRQPSWLIVTYNLLAVISIVAGFTCLFRAVRIKRGLLRETRFTLRNILAMGLGFPAGGVGMLLRYHPFVGVPFWVVGVLVIFVAAFIEAEPKSATP